MQYRAPGGRPYAARSAPAAPAAPGAPRRRRAAAPPPPPPPPRASFFEEGREGESRRALFDSISPVYDELNDLLSLGLHRVWKRMAVQWARAAPGQSALDACCGSGDLAFLLAEAVGPSGAVTGLDFAPDMLADAAARAAARAGRPGARPAARVDWVRGDATALPFADAAFDCATMGYGLRNVADIPAALAELRRVVRPGGRAAVLDFNHAEGPADWAQAALLERVVVPAAEARGVGEQYRYLRPSIERFPRGREQEALARAAGWARARHHEIGLGMMGCLVLEKGT